jgi:rubrerythrin
MITENHGYDYLKKVLELEIKMKNFYASVASNVEDAKIKEVCLHISKEEEKHENIVTEMMTILKKYI